MVKAFSKETPQLLTGSQLPELWARLQLTLDERGLMVLTGEPGVGKTAAVRAFCQRLDPTACSVFYLADASLTPRGLYRLLGAELGLELPWSTTESGRAVRAALDHRCAQGAVPLLILDEADELPTDTLAELRQIQNASMDARSPVAVVLVGTSALRQRLRLQSLASLAQRVTASYHLVGLTADETAAYIQLQLTLDGTPAVTFTPSAIDDIFHLTRGIPRLINRLCRTALLAVQSSAQPVIEPRIIRAAAIECGLA